MIARNYLRVWTEERINHCWLNEEWRKATYRKNDEWND